MQLQKTEDKPQCGNTGTGNSGAGSGSMNNPPRSLEKEAVQKCAAAPGGAAHAAGMQHGGGPQAAPGKKATGQ